MPRNKCVKLFSNKKCSKKLFLVNAFLRSKFSEILNMSVPINCHICATCKFNFFKKINSSSASSNSALPNLTGGNALQASTSQDVSTNTTDAKGSSSCNKEQEQGTPSSTISTSNTSSGSSQSLSASDENTFIMQRKLLVQNLNKYILPILKMDKIDEWRLSSENYVNKTLKKIDANMKINFIKNFQQEVEEISEQFKENSTYFNEIINGWKAKFPNSTRNEKQLILTSLPSSWSYMHLSQHFKVKFILHSENYQVINI